MFFKGIECSIKPVFTKDSGKNTVKYGLIKNHSKFKEPLNRTAQRNLHRGLQAVFPVFQIQFPMHFPHQAVGNIESQPGAFHSFGAAPAAEFFFQVGQIFRSRPAAVILDGSYEKAALQKQGHVNFCACVFIGIGKEVVKDLL